MTSLSREVSKYTAGVIRYAKYESEFQDTKFESTSKSFAIQDYQKFVISLSTLPHFHTSTLPHFHTSTLPHFHTSTLPHFHTSTLPHFHTSTLPHFHTSTLPHFHTSTLPHFHTSTLPHFHTSTLPHFHTSTLPHFHTSTQQSRVYFFPCQTRKLCSPDQCKSSTLLLHQSINWYNLAIVLRQVRFGGYFVFVKIVVFHMFWILLTNFPA